MNNVPVLAVTKNGNDIVFNWAAKNRYDFGRKSSFKIKIESPTFNNIQVAEKWISANILI